MLFRVTISHDRHAEILISAKDAKTVLQLVESSALKNDWDLPWNESMDVVDHIEQYADEDGGMLRSFGIEDADEYFESECDCGSGKKFVDCCYLPVIPISPCLNILNTREELSNEAAQA